MQIRMSSRAEMDARHAAHEARRRPPTSATAPAGPRNLEPVLDLGNLRFHMFRGRAYGVPPVPLRAGLRLQALWIEAAALGPDMTPEQAHQYAMILRQFPALMWPLVRPVGRVRRFLKAIGLHRNPFERASEGELVEWAGFFLRARMMSSVQLPSGLTPTPTPTRQTA